jgi:hypothetical protein
VALFHGHIVVVVGVAGEFAEHVPYYCRSVGRLSKRRACGVVMALNVLARATYPSHNQCCCCYCCCWFSQERWEAEQAKRTRRGGGNAEVLAEAAARDAEKYEMLFDDQIEYIKVRAHSML